MRKKISSLTFLCALSFYTLVLSSCLKDHCTHSYKIFVPVFKTLSDVRKEIRRMPAVPLGNIGKIYLEGNTIFINEKNKGVHIIDNANPSHPVNKSFINIPGNLDLAVRENILFADSYCDLTALDLGNPGGVTVQKFLTDIFPFSSYNGYQTANPDSIKVIVDWVSRDTVVSCETIQTWQGCTRCPVLYQDLAAASSSKSTGTGGSMARFAAVNNYLYALSINELNVINITTPSNPVLANKKYLGWSMETLFPFNNMLFVGSGASMSLYDIQEPNDPKQLSWSGHWCSHDPVIADTKYAYVTLHEASVCNNNVNQLEIYDLSSLTNPERVKTYPLTNPQGLSKDGNLLFICDGRDGLKIYDAADVMDIKLIKHQIGMQPYDVIALNGIAYITTSEGLFQYDYRDRNNIHLLSKLGLNQ